jgi:hypothetical protein
MNFKTRGALASVAMTLVLGAAVAGTGHSHAQSYTATAVPAVTGGNAPNPSAPSNGGSAAPVVSGLKGQPAAQSVQGQPAAQSVQGQPAAQSVQALPVTGGGSAPANSFDVFGLMAAMSLMLGGVVLRRRFSFRN